MGIYPSTKITDKVRHADGSETWTETLNNFDGVLRTRTVTASPYAETRVYCYCCSCTYDPEFGTFSVIDPYCRNHGFCGTRRCDKHMIDGDPFQDDDKTPLESVQQHRTRSTR